MDNSSNMAVNTTPTANQINPEHHYGLDKNKACLNNSCPSNTADIGCYIPATQSGRTVCCTPQYDRKSSKIK